MIVLSFYHGVASDIEEVLALIRILDLDELLALITRKFKIGALFYVFVIFKGLIEEYMVNFRICLYSYAESTFY